jgi:hypothetical protein
MFNPIFFNVLVKSRLKLLPLSMSTRVKCEPAMTGSRTSGNFSRLREASPLVFPRKGDRDLAVSQRFLYGRLDRENLLQGQLLCALQEEATVSTEDDVDDILRVLEVLGPRPVILIVIPLILPLSILRKEWSVE